MNKDKKLSVLECMSLVWIGLQVMKATTPPESFSTEGFGIYSVAILIMEVFFAILYSIPFVILYQNLKFNNKIITEVKDDNM